MENLASPKSSKEQISSSQNQLAKYWKKQAAPCSKTLLRTKVESQVLLLKFLQLSLSKMMNSKFIWLLIRMEISLRSIRPMCKKSFKELKEMREMNLSSFGSSIRRQERELAS